MYVLHSDIHCVKHGKNALPLTNWRKSTILHILCSDQEEITNLKFRNFKLDWLHDFKVQLFQMLIGIEPVVSKIIQSKKSYQNYGYLKLSFSLLFLFEGINSLKKQTRHDVMKAAVNKNFAKLKGKNLLRIKSCKTS